MATTRNERIRIYRFLIGGDGYDITEDPRYWIQAIRELIAEVDALRAESENHAAFKPMVVAEWSLKFLGDDSEGAPGLRAHIDDLTPLLTPNDLQWVAKISSTIQQGKDATAELIATRAELKRYKAIREMVQSVWALAGLHEDSPEAAHIHDHMDGLAESLTEDDLQWASRLGQALGSAPASFFEDDVS